MKKSIIFGMIIVSSTLFSEEGASVKPNECKGPVLCPSYPIYGRNDDCCDYRWHINLGLLYQQPWMSNMGAGTEDKGQDVLETNSPYKNATSTFLEECFDYSLGLTAAIGYFMDHDNWFLLAEFDWLSAKKSSSFDTPGSIYHMMGFTNLNVITVDSLDEYNIWRNVFTGLGSKSSLDIYELDVTLSRGSFHSRCFSYEPFAGVKALWYNGSQQRNGYNDTAQYFGDNNSYVQTIFSYKSWGAGLVFGFKGEYFLTEAVSIFSDSDISVLYGGINSSNTTLFINKFVNNETQGVAKYVQNFNQPYFVPVRSIFGLKFGKYCLEDKHYIALKIGYDARYIFADSGLFGYIGSGTIVDTALVIGSVPIMPTNGYNIAANGLYLNFIWNF